MTMNINIVLTSIIILSGAIIIDPTTNDQYATVSLAPDPRGINEITPDNQWKIYQSWSNPLYDWGLTMTLDAAKYSLGGGIADSMLSISIDGSIGDDQTDAYFAFSIGDNQYLTFITDLDGGYGYPSGGGTGIFIFPECGSTSIESGNPSTLLSSISQSPLTKTDIVNALADGNGNNWYKLTSKSNGDNFPLTFEFVNNNNDATFTYRFSSPTFSGNDALECTFNSSVDFGKDFKLYISPDGGTETIYVETITVNGINVGFTDNPTSSPTSSEPTTRNPTTSKPTTTNPTTGNPTTTKPTTGNPTTSNPTTSQPTTGIPTTHNPTTSNPTTYFPTTSNPTTFNPTTNNPTASNPTSAGPTTSQPTTAKPTTKDPTTTGPTTNNPTTNKPTTAKPTTSNPTTGNPTTAGPTTATPTTYNPTSSNPTTNRPTTGNPTTSDPTTFVPTTSNPTTSHPTTSIPTTTGPTTNNPTTDNPTTLDPTTDNPTTSIPTGIPSDAPTCEPTQDPTTTLTPTAAPITSDLTIDPTLDGCDFDIDAYLEKCYCQSPYDFDVAKMEQEIEIAEDLKLSEKSCEDFRDEIITTMQDNNNSMKIMIFALFGISISINICMGMLLLRKRDTKGYDVQNATFELQSFNFKDGDAIEESDSEINVKSTDYNNDGQN